MTEPRMDESASPAPAAGTADVAIVVIGLGDQRTQQLVAELSKVGYPGVLTAKKWVEAGKNGIKQVAAEGELPGVIVLMDDRCEPGQIERVVGPVVRGEASVVMGSRRLRQQMAGAMSLGTVAWNWLTCRLIWLRARRNYSDVGVYWALTRDALERIGPNRPAGMQLRAARLGIRVREVPVDYRR